VARITLDYGDAEATDQAALRLLAELRGLDEVRRVERERVPVPAGDQDPRSPELIAVGTLLATIAMTPEVLGGVLSYLGEWLHRPGNRRGSIHLRMPDGKEITLDNPSAEERRKLIDAFIVQMRRR
jgi:hypothetical protein